MLDLTNQLISTIHDCAIGGSDCINELRGEFRRLANYGLLNNEYTTFINKADQHALLTNAGRVLTHSACMARHRGLIGIARVLLLLGMAIDDALLGRGGRFNTLLTVVVYLLHGEDGLAGEALAGVGFDFTGLDGFLNACALLVVLYELGVRFW